MEHGTNHAAKTMGIAHHWRRGDHTHTTSTVLHSFLVWVGLLGATAKQLIILTTYKCEGRMAPTRD